jgi:hypothetical protein
VKLNIYTGQAHLSTFVIPALGTLKHENREFEASCLGYIARPYLKKQIQNKKNWLHRLVAIGINLEKQNISEINEKAKSQKSKYTMFYKNKKQAKFHLTYVG